MAGEDGTRSGRPRAIPLASPDEVNQVDDIVMADKCLSASKLYFCSIYFRPS